MPVWLRLEAVVMSPSQAKFQRVGVQCNGRISYFCCVFQGHKSFFGKPISRHRKSRPASQTNTLP